MEVTIIQMTKPDSWSIDMDAFQGVEPVERSESGCIRPIAEKPEDDTTRDHEGDEGSALSVTERSNKRTWTRARRLFWFCVLVMLISGLTTSMDSPNKQPDQCVKQEYGKYGYGAGMAGKTEAEGPINPDAIDKIITCVNANTILIVQSANQITQMIMILILTILLAMSSSLGFIGALSYCGKHFKGKDYGWQQREIILLGMCGPPIIITTCSIFVVLVSRFVFKF